MAYTQLILASGSPRRRQLLSDAGYAFDVVVSHAAEAKAATTEPAALAEHNARAKAQAVAQGMDGDFLVIGADTIVVRKGHVYGKPRDDADARRILAELSGQMHQVITGVCLAGPYALRTFHETTEVVFRDLSEREIASYVATGEPRDKAGAYGIQGMGGKLVDHIDGDYDNVVGLPVARLTRELASLGIMAGS